MQKAVGVGFDKNDFQQLAVSVALVWFMIVSSEAGRPDVSKAVSVAPMGTHSSGRTTPDFWTPQRMAEADKFDQTTRIMPASFLRHLNRSISRGSNEPPSTGICAPYSNHTRVRRTTATSSMELPLDYFGSMGFGSGVVERANERRWADTMTRLSVNYADTESNWFKHYGKFYFKNAFGSYGTCTAMLYSHTVAITAAHCVRDQHGWFSDMTFYRKYRGYHNYGTKIRVLTSVTSTAYARFFDGSWGDVRYDVAFLLLESDHTYEENNIYMDWTADVPSVSVASAGYPVNYDNAERLVYAYNTVQKIDQFRYMQGNSMGGGASGGPWLYWDADAGRHYIMGVNAFRLSWMSGIFSPFFGRPERVLWDYLWDTVRPEYYPSRSRRLARNSTEADLERYIKAKGERDGNSPEK